MYKFEPLLQAVQRAPLASALLRHKADDLRSGGGCGGGGGGRAARGESFPMASMVSASCERECVSVCFQCVKQRPPTRAPFLSCPAETVGMRSWHHHWGRTLPLWGGGVAQLGRSRRLAANTTSRYLLTQQCMLVCNSQAHTTTASIDVASAHLPPLRCAACLQPTTKPTIAALPSAPSKHTSHPVWSLQDQPQQT